MDMLKIAHEMEMISNQVKTAVNHGLLENMNGQEIFDFCVKGMKTGDQARFSLSGIDKGTLNRLAAELIKRGFVTYIGSVLNVFRKSKVSSVEVTAVRDYVYDPDHEKNPKGGGWHKTPNGWSRKEISDEEDSQLRRQHLDERYKKEKENRHYFSVPSYRSGVLKLKDEALKPDFEDSVKANKYGLTPTEVSTLASAFRIRALEISKDIVESRKEGKDTSKQLETLKRCVGLVKALRAIKFKHQAIPQPEVKPLPALPNKTYDFSGETYYASRPEEKAAVDAVMKDVEALKAADKEVKKFEDERPQRQERAREKGNAFLKEHGLSSSKELTPELKEKYFGIWLEEDAEADNAAMKAKDLKNKISKRIGDIMPSVYIGYYDDPKDIEKKVKQIPVNHFGAAIAEKVKQSPEITAPESGTYVAIGMQNGFEFFSFDRVTASGQIRATNLFSGDKKNISPKEWDSIKGGARLLTPELAEEGMKFMEYVSKEYDNSKS